MNQNRKAFLAHAKAGVPACAGERNGRARLSAIQAAEIAGSSMPLSQIMAKFGISKSQASRVRGGMQWQ